MAEKSSSSSAGISRFVLRYTRNTCSTFLFLTAALAVSIAVFPPPITTIFLPRSRFPALFLKSSRNSCASSASPFSREILPGTLAPTHKTMDVNPSPRSSLRELIFVFVLISTPIFSRIFTSLPTASSLMRKDGMSFSTTPPGLSFFSKIVTVIPARLKKYAADIPAGPPPITAAFPSYFISGTFCSASHFSYPFSAAISFIFRMSTGSS